MDDLLFYRNWCRIIIEFELELMQGDFTDESA